MAKYLDETGLRTLWTKIKGTFVAQTIKKSDSSNATQITHNGDTVSLSRGTMIPDDTVPGGAKYLRKTGITINGNDIHFLADHRPAYKATSDENFTNFVISSDIATSSTAGLVKSTTTGKTANRDYMVEVNSDGTMKVNVPWTDNNTTYSAGTGLSLSGTTFSVKTGYSESGKNYAVKTDTNGNLYVNVPWTDNNTTVDSALNSTSTNPVQNKVIFTALNNKLDTSVFNIFKGLKGQANGLAELDSSGRVPSSQLPSYVDDVIEGYYYNSKFYKESSHTNEIAGESGKIYTDLGNNKTYRWSGTTYTEISASLALGETESTAYPGNKGKANATNIANNTTNITTLKGYFTNGVAKQAAADGNGKNIVDTYATKSTLSTTNSNVSTNTSDITTLKGYFINGAADKAIADEDGNPIKTNYVKISGGPDATTGISSYIKNLGNEIQLYLAKNLTKYTEVDLGQTGVFITAGNHSFNFENGGDFYYSNIDDDNVYLFLNQKNHTPITNDEINAICQ